MLPPDIFFSEAWFSPLATLKVGRRAIAQSRRLTLLNGSTRESNAYKISTALQVRKTKSPQPHLGGQCVQASAHPPEIIRFRSIFTMVN